MARDQKARIDSGGVDGGTKSEVGNTSRRALGDVSGDCLGDRCAKVVVESECSHIITNLKKNEERRVTQMLSASRVAL
jgi:hypothetical protein